MEFETKFSRIKKFQFLYDVKLRVQYLMLLLVLHWWNLISLAPLLIDNPFLLEIKHKYKLPESELLANLLQSMKFCATYSAYVS